MTKRSLHPALAYGAALLVVLVGFRLERAVRWGLEPSLLGWLGQLVPEVGFVLLFESVWLLLERTGAAGRRLARWGILPAHALVAAVALIDHVFFLHTGTRLSWELARYAAEQLGQLRGLLGTGFDAAFYLRLGLVLLALAAGAWLARSFKAVPAAGVRDRGGAVGIFGLLLGIALLVGGAPSGPAAALGSTPLVELFRRPGGPDLGSRDPAELPPGVSRWVTPPDALYRAPEIVAPPASEPANVVLFILESTRWDAVPPEALAATSPALADLAERAVVFDSAYASVTHTSKALVGLLCGMFPRLSMPIVESLEGNLPLACLPHLLGEAGYRTAFLQTAPAGFENRPGLVRNLGFGQAAFRESLAREGFAQAGYLGLDELAMVEPALSWVREGGPEPFFVTLLTIIPHHPYEVPGEESLGVLGPRQIEQYRRALAHQDRFVGELVDGLAAAERLGDTVLIVVGDHGEAFGEHGRFQHDAVPYEEAVRVPLMIVGPEEIVGPPRKVGGLRHHMDLLPTVLELAGTEWQGTLPGRNLLAGDGHPWIFTSCWYTDYCASWVTGDLKVIYHFGRRPTEIFNLTEDPGEERDLAPALPPEQLAQAEARALGAQMSIDLFWSRHPARPGPEDWWRERGP